VVRRPPLGSRSCGCPWIISDGRSFRHPGRSGLERDPSITSHGPDWLQTAAKQSRRGRRSHSQGATEEAHRIVDHFAFLTIRATRAEKPKLRLRIKRRLLERVATSQADRDRVVSESPARERQSEPLPVMGAKEAAFALLSSSPLRGGERRSRELRPLPVSERPARASVPAVRRSRPRDQLNGCDAPYSLYSLQLDIT
jgi:hypothetical protein